MNARALFPGIGTLVALAIVGCGEKAHQGPAKQKTVAVTGVLKHRGKSVPNASVTFHSIDGKVSSHGTTDAAGVFTLSTYGAQDGAPPGKYKVTVAASSVKEIEPGVLAPEPEGGFKSPVPSKYANPATTDVLVEVKEEGKNDLTINLK